jgi:hypothetical protein
LSPSLNILLVLVVVAVIGAGLFFQERNGRSNGGVDTTDVPDAPKGDGDAAGGGSGDGAGDGGGGAAAGIDLPAAAGFGRTAFA